MLFFNILLCNKFPSIMTENKLKVYFYIQHFKKQKIPTQQKQEILPCHAFLWHFKCQGKHIIFTNLYLVFQKKKQKNMGILKNTLIHTQIT